MTPRPNQTATPGRLARPFRKPPEWYANQLADIERPGCRHVQFQLLSQFDTRITIAIIPIKAISVAVAAAIRGVS